jgi:hypothetical protein
MGGEDASTSDAATDDDGGSSDGDAGGGGEDAGMQDDMASTADMGPNMEVDITATVGDTTEGFDRAYYGLTSPELTVSGDWELQVEVYAGGDEGCPQMDSATPDRTLVIGGLRFPEFPNEQREEDGVVMVLMDFAGTLTQEPTVEATGEIIYFHRWDLCTDCDGDDPNGFLSFDVDSLVPDGNIRGHVYATHCASLNSP